MPRPHVVLVSLALALASTGIAPVRANTGLDSIPHEVAQTLESSLLNAAPSLDPRVLGLALEAHKQARVRHLLTNPDLLTVIDYSRPSTEERFWVFDLKARKLLFEERVAHGKNSGDEYANRFSNTESSLQTSLGLFVTQDIYFGKHGESLRMVGLEPGVNDAALARAIVIHGADYVSDNAVAALGFLGRSWGCPALAPQVASKVIGTIQGGSAIFSYYPDQDWLTGSQFVDVSVAEMGLLAQPLPALTLPVVPIPADMAVLVPADPPVPLAPITVFPLRLTLMS
jgi:hypothetical protein